MLANIDIILTRWALWSIQSEVRSVGYPSKCPMFRDTPSSGRYQSSEPIGLGTTSADYKEVTKAVDSLPLVQKACVVEYYQRNAGAEEAASRLGIKKGVMFKYIHLAHEAIECFLCETV
jgi:DNA-directed RNA polymerase specialized sigma24 family protein